MRVKRGIVGNRKKRELRKAAKGFVGGRRKLMRATKETVHKAMAYSYRDRRQKKREFRSLWIARINAAVRQEGNTYSRFIAALDASNVELDRKVLADIAVTDPKGFSFILNTVATA
jgi:large subunit ribosomal protein L20